MPDDGWGHFRTMLDRLRKEFFRKARKAQQIYLEIGSFPNHQAHKECAQRSDGVLASVPWL